MKKIILFLLLSIATYGQVSTGQEQEFDYGIKNNAAQEITTPTYIGTLGVDGTNGKIPSAYIEKTDNKQNSLAIDGTGVKYVTVDAVNDALPKNYAKIVYVNSTNPSTATIFDIVNSPVTNDNLLKTDVANLYIGTDASTWVYNGLLYVTKTITDKSNFWISNTSLDAGADKNRALSRTGTIESTGFIKTGGLSSQALLANGTVLTNPVSGTGTLNYIPKFTASGTVGNSKIYDNGTNVGIGTTTPIFGLDIQSINGIRISTSNFTSGFGRPSIRQDIFDTGGGFVCSLFELYAGNFSGAPITKLLQIGAYGSTNSGINPSTLSYMYFGTEPTVAYNNNTFRIYPNKTSYFDGNVGIGTTTPSAKLVVNSGELLVNTNVNNGVDKLQVNGSTKTDALTLSTAPTTSASTYDILTRNSSTGVVEKISSSAATNWTLTGNDLKNNNIGKTTIGNPTIGFAYNLGLGVQGKVVAIDGFRGNSYRDISEYELVTSDGSGNTSIRSQGSVSLLSPLRLKNYTVATLPTGTQGDTAYVTDALAPTYLVTVVGGGAVVCPVFFNGTNWVSH